MILSRRTTLRRRSKHHGARKGGEVEQRPQPTPWGRLIAIGLVALLAFVTSSANAALPPNPVVSFSPEWTARIYVAALGNFDTDLQMQYAHGKLAEDIASTREAAQAWREHVGPVRITDWKVKDSREDGDRYTLTAEFRTVEIYGEEPVAAIRERQFTLQKVDGEWRVTRVMDSDNSGGSRAVSAFWIIEQAQRGFGKLRMPETEIDYASDRIAAAMRPVSFWGWMGHPGLSGLKWHERVLFAISR